MISNNKRFNLIGFSFSNSSNSYEDHKHCSIHNGSRLLKDEQDPDLWFCPQCGTRYKISETVEDQDIQSNLSPTNSNVTKIISGKKKTKKHYDSFGALIPEDPDMQNLIARGYKIISYHEQKSDSGNKFVRKIR